MARVVRNPGATALAREVGTDAGQVSKMLDKGMTREEIVAKFAARKGISMPTSQAYQPQNRNVKMGQVVISVPKSKENGQTNGHSEPKANGRPVGSGLLPPPVLDQEGLATATVWAETEQQAKLRKTIAEANDKEFKLEILKGRFAPVNSMVLWQLNRDMKLTDMLMQLPGLLGTKFAAETDPIKIEQWLTEELRRILDQMSNYNGAKPEDVADAMDIEKP